MLLKCHTPGLHRFPHCPNSEPALLRVQAALEQEIPSLLLRLLELERLDLPHHQHTHAFLPLVPTSPRHTYLDTKDTINGLNRLSLVQNLRLVTPIRHDSLLRALGHRNGQQYQDFLHHPSYLVLDVRLSILHTQYEPWRQRSGNTA